MEGKHGKLREKGAQLSSTERRGGKNEQIKVD